MTTIGFPEQDTSRNLEGTRKLPANDNVSSQRIVIIFPNKEPSLFSYVTMSHLCMESCCLEEYKSTKVSIMFPLGFRNKKDERKKVDCFFMKNGAVVLEKLIRLHNGDCNPIRSYSAQQLHNATDNYRWEIHEDWNYKLYRGFHEDRVISVKKFKSHEEDQLQRIANEVAIASRMSNHNNVLKLLGCCLETELPLLAYEFPVLGNLGSTIYRPIDNQLPWELRSRMVTGIANAVAYLHHGLSKRIIHRDIKPRNIFLDESHTAKLFEFQEAIPIPEGETHVDVETLFGTIGFLAPEVAMHKRHTEKSDVYAFGVLLFEVLTGKKLLSWEREIFNEKNSDSSVQSDNICWQQGETGEPGSLSVQPNDSSEEIIHECSNIYPQEEAKRAPPNSSDLKKGNFHERVIEYYFEIHPHEENRAQVPEYVKLVLRCVKENPDERPNMIEVEKALRRIKTI